ncbi:hypothetical protein JZX87_27985 [Agrobacterium sp. Ap1]|jgi:hypothetical protein|uniref:hypothetical protein n=1 Tax=Rhizobium/Agrobacterium group TaxID=227290 RepID=UPI001A8EE0E0|nr:hypothetical protein [Agrobacterium sp. Ap1]MBO0144982.1 hypothetical protein [Agrobacterium sp. Ap1]
MTMILRGLPAPTISGRSSALKARIKAGFFAMFSEIWVQLKNPTRIDHDCSNARMVKPPQNMRPGVNDAANGGDLKTLDILVCMKMTED